jgi:ABC-2 type transport system ATP-binding protein
MIYVDSLSKFFNVNIDTGKGMFSNLISRNTKRIQAVNNVSFEIQPGEVVGYLGPNGAGKSTTIKMLSGLLVPSSGEVTVHGMVPWKHRERYVEHIGVVFGQRSTLWWDLPVIESLELLRFMYRIPERQFAASLRECSDLLGLDGFLHQPVRSLSLGQRMRADLAAALLHHPRLLFLDEPTIGLDVVAKERMRGFIEHINREYHTTVILTTHDLADVARLCQRVMMIDHGQLLYDGLLAELIGRFGGERSLVVDFASTPDKLELSRATLLSVEGLRAHYQFTSDVNPAELIAELTKHCSVRDLALHEPDVEATIRNIYEHRLLDGR